MWMTEDLQGFYGTGERNEAGQSLEEFLEAYDPKRYDCPANTTDIVVVRSEGPLIRKEQPLQVLMVKRRNHPSIGWWATPGGFVELREDLDAGAARELEEETGVKGLPLVQLRTWGDFRRDPRWRVITTSYLGLVEGDVPVQAGDDAAEALWMDASLERECDEVESDEGEHDERECGEEKSGRQASSEKGSCGIWRLILRNPEAGISLMARVAIRRGSHPVVSEEEYQLVESRGIAVDHGCIIAQALRYLYCRLS